MLIETLPHLSPPEAPIELVFVGTSELLVEALGKGDYRPADGCPPHLVQLFDRAPDTCVVGQAAPYLAIGFWHSYFTYRGHPVWFGRFSGPVTNPQLTALARALTRSHYTLRAAIGPRVRPRERQRILYAVLRDPDLQAPAGGEKRIRSR